MIIELAKDKSLKTALLKSKVDENTMALVKSDASISLIKNSLVENINGDNIIQYRKYIRKAEEEEEAEGGAKACGMREDVAAPHLGGVRQARV